MQKINVILGKLGLAAANLLPDNGFAVNLGQRAVRGFFARMMLEQCGRNVNIHKHTSFSHTCHIGNDSGIGRNSVLSGTVYIGNDVMMGPECLIYTQNHAYDDLTVPMRLQGPQPMRPVVIEDDVWIGGRVTILPGVHVSGGAVIGAGAVVTKDVPENAVVAGNPARIVRYRGTEKSTCGRKNGCVGP